MSMPSTDQKRQAVDIGFVDTYENGHFSGWYYSNHDDYQREILLKINSHEIKRVQTNVERIDVAEQLGITQTSCGFNFVLDLVNLPTDGCTISFHDPLYGKQLNNGVFQYQSGKLLRTESTQTYRTQLEIKSYINILQAAQSGISSASFIKLACDKLRTQTDASFVALSYMLILGRTPDPIGFLNSLHPDLSTDAGRKAFITTMINSGEFNSKRSISLALADLGKLG